MKTWINWMLMLTAAIPAGAFADPGTGDTLTVEQALERAHRSHPGLAAVPVEVTAATESAQQAEAWPNPAFFFKMEGAPFDGDAWNDAHHIYGLAQELPVSGRIGATGGVARARTEQIQREGELYIRSTEAGVRAAFARAVHARDALAVNREAMAVAQRLHDLVAERAAAGDTPVSDRRRARMELGVAQAELLGAEALATAALADLAAAVGDAEVVGLELVATPVAELAPPALAEIMVGLDRSPQQRLADSRLTEQEALITEASRRRWPDLLVEAAFRDAPGGHGFDAGIAVALPLWDRGGARLSATQAGAAAADHRRRTVRQNLEAQVRRVHAELEAAVGELEVYDRIVLPEADAAVRSAEAAYSAGDAGLTAVLQITRDWHDVRQARLERRLALELSWAELFKLL